MEGKSARKKEKTWRRRERNTTRETDNASEEVERLKAKEIWMNVEQIEKGQIHSQAKKKEKNQRIQIQWEV
jgi:hypothetical protein